jgi:hypothetical protein
MKRFVKYYDMKDPTKGDQTEPKTIKLLSLESIGSIDLIEGKNWENIYVTTKRGEKVAIKKEAFPDICAWAESEFIDGTL